MQRANFAEKKNAVVFDWLSHQQICAHTSASNMDAKQQSPSPTPLSTEAEIEPPTASLSSPDQHASTPTPPSAPEEETRVITLDTIIRKGLVEQMPMTAKDVVNIVSKSMQKERERQAADKLRLLARLQQPQSASPSKLSVQLGTDATGASNASDSDDDDDGDEDDEDNDDDDEEEEDRNGDAGSSTATDGEQDGNPNDEQPLQPQPIKQPTISVIQRAPPPNHTCNEMQLAEDLRASNAKGHSQHISEDPLEDCELRSGDLHYSESNPSDYSDAEPHQHQRSTTKARASQRRKRSTGRTLPGEPGKKPRSCPTSPKDLTERSCTDSQRNAILMQCSAAAASVTAAHTKASPTEEDDDDDDDRDEAGDGGVGEDQVDGAHLLSHQPQLAPMQMHNLLQVQHTMNDDEEEEENTTVSVSAGPPSPAPSLVIKQERLTPDCDDMLEIHHVEDFRPAHLDGKGRGNDRFERSSYATSPEPDKHTLPYIQAVFSQATTSNVPPVAGDKQRRDKRKTVTKTAPGVYAELSDNSNEPDAISRSVPKKQRSPKAAASSAATAKKSAATAKGKESDATAAAVTPQKLHWKTQLKLQRQLHEAAATAAAESKTAAKTSVEWPDSQTPLKSSPLTKNERIDKVDNGNDDQTGRNGAGQDKEEDAMSSAPPGSPVSSTDGSPETGSNKINKIIEPPHHQKRIPKLKYGSFNFTERRSGPEGNKGPKMVLKYKKKYKRKTATPAKSRQSAVGDTERVDSTPLAVSTELTADVAGTETSPSVPNGKVTGNATTNAKKAAIVKKRKSTKPSSSSSCTASFAQSSNSANPNSSLAEPPHKQAKPTTTTNTSTTNKRLISTSTTAGPMSTNAVTTTDSTRALRERNKVLLELLEHRIYEIRHLKLRLAHMQQLTTAVYPSASALSSALPTTPELSNGCPPSFASKSTAPKLIAKLEPGASVVASTANAAATDWPVPLSTAATAIVTPSSDATTPDWSADELAQAHYLHSLHPQLYAHLQQHYALPLPLDTECRAWRSQAELADVVRTMRAAQPHLSALQRVAVLHITDLPLRPAYEYVVRSDRLSYTAARRLWVLWARGLHADWQQPMFVSTVGVAELVPAIRECIARLHDIQYTVIACCARSDEPTEDEPRPDERGQCNGTASEVQPTTASLASLWQQLGVSRGYTYFSHPTTNEPIYTFHFGDDLLRSVQRNLLHAGGFRAGEPVATSASKSTPTAAASCTAAAAAAVTREPLDELRSVAPAWFADATSSARTLFSSRTSELLRAVRPTDFGACADFVDVFAAFGRLIFDDGTYGGDRLESQMRTLSHVQLQLYRMRDTSEATDNSLAASNAAISHTIESLKLLQHTMRQKYGVDELPVRSVSEDCLRRRWQPEGTWTEVVARSLRETLTRLVQVAVPGGSAAVSASAAAVPSMRGQSVSSWPGGIDVSLPERHYVQQLIEDTMRTDPPPSTSATGITLADQRKFVASLWRMEEQFQALWTPFFVGGPNRERMTAATEASDGDVSGELVLEHVLRDTLGKCGRLSSWPLESSVHFVLRRIALRVAVVNELGGVQRWPAYVLGTTTTASNAAAAASRRSVD